MTIKVALACPGLGRISRGFETFMSDLYFCLKSTPGLEVTLLKGGGTRRLREIPLPNISRASPVWQLTGGLIDPYIGEQISFALPLARYLRRAEFDIVHFSDGQLGSILLRLVPAEARGFRLVYSNGGPLSPPQYERFDYVQQVSPVEMQTALEYGYPEERMTLVPYGVFHDRFGKSDGKDLAEDIGIHNDVPVVLSVGAHGGHKRLEFLIQQLARVEASFHLLLLGEEHRSRTPYLRSIATDLLPDRVTFLHLPHERIPSAYALADVYVHAGLREGLPLALLEAMAAGLPVIHHDEPGMNWLVGEGGLALDMRDAESLIEGLGAVISNPAARERLGQRGRRRAEGSFSWEVLLPRYVKMYEDALSLPLC